MRGDAWILDAFSLYEVKINERKSAGIAHVHFLFHKWLLPMTPKCNIPVGLCLASAHFEWRKEYEEKAGRWGGRGGWGHATGMAEHYLLSWLQQSAFTNQPSETSHCRPLPSLHHSAIFHLIVYSTSLTFFIATFTSSSSPFHVSYLSASVYCVWKTGIRFRKYFVRSSKVWKFLPRLFSGALFFSWSLLLNRIWKPISKSVPRKQTFSRYPFVLILKHN